MLLYSVAGYYSKDFAIKWRLTNITSSPHYPRVHAFIERQVQIIKKLVSRCDEDGISYQIVLCELRAATVTARHHHQESFYMAGS